MTVEQLTSIKDPRIKHARSLHSRKERTDKEAFLLFGQEQILWAQKANIKLDYVFALKEDPLIKAPTFLVSQHILKKISDTSYLVPQVGVAQIKKNTTSNPQQIIVLDGLQDHGNIGSIIRTALSFYIELCIFVNMEIDPFQRKVIDASRGSVFMLPILESSSIQEIIKKLQQEHYDIVVTCPNKETVPIKKGSLKKALVFGNETRGISSEFSLAANQIFTIPSNPKVDSLNVSVAAGISMYAYLTC